MNENFEILGTRLIAYYGTEQTVFVPDGITEIGSESFLKNESIRKIILPEGICKIQSYAFALCSNLEEIQLPESLQSIENRAFYLCKNLWKIRFPNSLKKIGTCAFRHCEALFRVHIPENIEQLEKFAFADCKYLTDVRLPSGWKHIPEGCFYGCTSLRDFSFPDTLKSIGPKAFSYTNGLKLRLPESLEKIGFHAFALSRNMTVFFPSHITEIPEKLFDHSDSHVIFAPSVPFSSLSPKNKTAAVIGYAQAPEALLAVFPKESEEEYLRYLFRYRKKFYPHIAKHEALLAKMTEHRLIPYEETQALSESFSENPALTAMILSYQNMLLTPEMILKLERKAKRETENIFSDRPPSITEVRKDWLFEKLDNGTYLLRSYKGNATEILVPDRIGTCPVSAIGDYAFSPFRLRLTDEQQKIRHSITTVIIPASVQKLGSHLFYGCSSLEEVRLPDEITELREFFFCDCEKLRTVSLPETLQTIGTDAFARCYALVTFVKKESYAEQYLRENEIAYLCE
ncbi:MAG: leucine-rich repeat domain-containing protein [Clostridia bacterium]|nr:leucine-rich repeat domain-containing protein [Clostridia bacterium]